MSRYSFIASPPSPPKGRRRRWRLTASARRGFAPGQPTMPPEPRGRRRGRRSFRPGAERARLTPSSPTSRRRWVEARAAEGEAAAARGTPVVADQQADGAEVCVSKTETSRRRRRARGSWGRPCGSGRFLPVAPQQEGGVVDFAVGSTRSLQQTTCMVFRVARPGGEASGRRRGAAPGSSGSLPAFPRAQASVSRACRDGSRSGGRLRDGLQVGEGLVHPRQTPWEFQRQSISRSPAGRRRGGRWAGGGTSARAGCDASWHRY
jgi:hypothetical protein